MSRILAAWIFGIGAWINCCQVAYAAPPEMINEGQKAWVYRRHSKVVSGMETGGNDIKAVRLRLHLDRVTGDDSKVQGTLTIWTSVSTSGTTYTGRQDWTLPPTPVTNPGTASRLRETCRWDGTMGTQLPTGGPYGIKIYASLFQGKTKGNGQGHGGDERFIVRCRMGNYTAPAGRNCDGEPDDDVLDEENDPPSDTPPYDP